MNHRWKPVLVLTLFLVLLGPGCLGAESTPPSSVEGRSGSATVGLHAQAKVVAGAGVEAAGIGPYRSEAAHFDVEGGQILRASLNVSWVGNTPSASRVQVEFYCCNDAIDALASGEGGFEFTVQIPVERLESGGDFFVFASPVEGAFLDQVIDLELSIEYAVAPT